LKQILVGVASAHSSALSTAAVDAILLRSIGNDIEESGELEPRGVPPSIGRDLPVILWQARHGGMGCSAMSRGFRRQYIS